MFKRLLYHSFRLSYLVGRWYKHRFTKAGLVVLVGLLVTGAVGMDTTRTMAYQAFTFLWFLVLVALVWSRLFPARFEAHRILPQFTTVGERFTYVAVIKNRTEKTQIGLTFLESFQDPRPTLEELSHTQEPGEQNRNVFDRMVGFHRWQWLIAQKRGAKVDEQPLPPISPNGEGEIRVEVLPTRRGRLGFTEIIIARPDPFGLYKSFARVSARQSVLVLPQRYPIPPINLPGTRRYQPGGVALAHSVGDSEEFMSMRDYRPGDPLRRIHWKSWAKTGKPIVKEYQDEFYVRHGLILDTFQKSEDGESFEEAVSIAASFASSVQTQESLLDLMFVGPEAYCFTSGRGVAHSDRMLEILASVRACQDKPFSTLVPLVMERSSLLSGCICVLLGWDADRKDLVFLLQELGIPTMVLVITGGEDQQRLQTDLDQDRLDNFHLLQVGKVEEGLANL
jgi:uncharacterized protein (DUF58 family)